MMTQMAWASAAALLASLVSCGGTTDGRIVDVEGRQRDLDMRVTADERRAAKLRAEAIQLQQVLEAQRRCIAWQECQARTSRLSASVAARLAECNMHTANWYACTARRTQNTAAGAGLGCLLGWAAAVATGGAVAPAVMIGCGAGAAAGHEDSAGPCTHQRKPQPCGQMQHVFESQALQAEGLSSMPACGPMPQECALLNTPSP